MDPVLTLVIIGLFFFIISAVLWYVGYKETAVPPPEASPQPKKWSWAWGVGAMASFIIGVVVLSYAAASRYKILAEMFSLTPSFGRESPTNNCGINGHAIVPTTGIELDPDDRVEDFFVRAYKFWHNTVEFKTKAGRYLRGHLCASGESTMSFVIEKSTKEYWKQTKWVVRSSTRTVQECNAQIHKLNSLGSHYLAGVNDCRLFAALFGTFLSI